MKKIIFLSFASLLFPLVTYASNLGNVADVAISTINAAVPMLVGFAIVAFFWGIVKYIWRGEDEEARKESKQFMLWGVIGITVMISVWALTSILAGLFGMHLPLTPTLPTRQ